MTTPLPADYGYYITPFLDPFVEKARKNAGPYDMTRALADALAYPAGPDIKNAERLAERILAGVAAAKLAQKAKKATKRDTEAWAREWRRLQNVLTVLVQGPHFDLHDDIQEGARIFLLAVLLETEVIPDIVTRDPEKGLSFEAELVDYVRMTPGHPVDFGPLAAALLDDRLKTVRLAVPFGTPA